MRKSSIGWKIDNKTKQEVTDVDKEIVVQKGAQRQVFRFVFQTFNII